jgi:hypothetical protein
MTTSQLLAMPFPAVGAIAAVLTGALARRIWANCGKIPNSLLAS